MMGCLAKEYRSCSAISETTCRGYDGSFSTSRSEMRRCDEEGSTPFYYSRAGRGAARLPWVLRLCGHRKIVKAVMECTRNVL